MSNSTKLLSSVVLAVIMLSVSTQNLNAQCNAAFSYSVNAPAVSFFAQDSMPQKANAWHFGDGQTSFGAFTTHAYYQPGQYLVTHYIFDSLNNCSDSSQQMVSVNFTATCQAYFISYPLGDSVVSNQYYFGNNSEVSGGLSAVKTSTWSVNGVQVGTLEDLNYTFTQAGTYNVCLSIETKAGCTSQYCQNITVYGKCNLSPSFTYTVDSSYPANVTLYPHPDEPYAQYKWRINGALISTKTPFTQYYQGGTYPVTLYMEDTVEKCYDSATGSFTVPVFPCDTLHFSYNYHVDSKDSALVYFSAQTNDSTTWQRWSIAPYYWSPNYDSSSYAVLNTNNPTYRFTDTGTYQVCLQANLQHCNYGEWCSIVAITSTSKSGGANHIVPYPNPATNTVGVDVPLAANGTIAINVYDAGGILVLTVQQQGAKGNNRITLPVKQLNKGQYFIDITAGANRLRSIFQKF